MRNKLVFFLLCCGIVFLLLGFIGGKVLNGEKQNTKNVAVKNALGVATTSAKSPPGLLTSDSKIFTEQITVAPTSSVSVRPAITGQTALVTRVVDGDTIDVSLDGSVQRVRLIGVNTPETVDPKKPVECYGPESSKEVQFLLNGKNVVLVADASQSDRDKYNRLLRYVFLDGTDVDLFLIQQGFGYEYTYKIPYMHQQEFIAAQQEAQKEGKGLWSACK